MTNRRALTSDEIDAVSGGCPLDLRGSGMTPEMVADLCREFTRETRTIGPGKVDTLALKAFSSGKGSLGSLIDKENFHVR